MSSPYRRVFARTRSREAAARGWPARLALAGVAVGTVVGVAILARPIFLGFLDGGRDGWAAGLAAVWLRAGLLVQVVMGLAVHGAVVRGDDRAVLSLHPVAPRAVVVAELEDALVRRLPFLAAVAAVLGPIGPVVGWDAWALGALVVGGSAMLGLVLGAVAFLTSIRVAEEPAWAGLLDLLRGNNPRPQAAIIYALAPSTLLGGALAVVAADAAVVVWQGHAGGWLGLLAPWGVAGAAWLLVPGLARDTWFRASVVLADIQARYAALERPEERTRVFMDWAVRFVPPTVGRWMLLDLRYGWRARRSWLSALWLVGVGAVAAGWTAQPDGPVRAALVAGAGGWWVGTVALFGAADEAPFLRVWLPRGPAERGLARLAAVLAWTSGPAAAGAVAVLLRQGPVSALASLGGALGVAAVGGAVAAGLARWPRHAVAPYAGLAALVLAGVGAWWWGGAM